MSTKDLSEYRFKELALKTKAYVWCWIALFIPLAIWTYIREPLSHVNLLDFFIFLALAVFFSLRPLTTFQGGGSFDISTIIWSASILLFRTEVVVLLIFLSNLLVDITERKKIWRLSLNATTWSIIYFSAATSYNYFKADQPFYTNLLVNIPAFFALICILTGVIVLSYSLTYSLINNKSIAQNLRMATRGMLIYEFSQYPVGILLAMVYHYQRFGLVLFILPFLLFYFSHGYQKRLAVKEQEAIKDPLTGLYNRRYFNQVLSNLFGSNARTFSIIIFDVDDFKKLNDTEGHMEGDVVLKAVSKIVTDTSREKDLVFRYGGDEFCIILPETTKQQAFRLANRLRAETESYFADNKRNLTISLGVANFPANGIIADQLIKKADQAMYEAKRAGKNRVKAA